MINTTLSKTFLWPIIAIFSLYSVTSAALSDSALSIDEQVDLVETQSEIPSTLKEFSTVTGKLVFASQYQRENSDLVPFLDIREFRNEKKSQTLLVPVKHGQKSTFRPRAARGVFFDPQFSPNGECILFKYGDYGLTGAYHLYVYDLKERKTYLICDEILSYYSVSWSPDSQYVAFAKGGFVNPMVYAYGRTYDEAINLCITNWRTGKEYDVVTSSSLRGDWEWIAPHTLVYGDMDEKDVKFRNNPNYQAGVDFENGEPIGWERLKNEPKRTPVTTKIYKYSINDQRKVLLYHPVVSPNGKYIAYFGSKDDKQPMYLNKHWKDAPSGQYLMIKSLDKNDSQINAYKKLGQYYKSYPHVQWSPDNKSLLISEITQKKSRESLRCNISKIDIATGKQTKIASIQTENAGDPPVFNKLVFSTDNQRAIIIIYELDVVKDSVYSNKNLVLGISLNDGKVKKILDIKDELGVSWIYDRE